MTTTTRRRRLRAGMPRRVEALEPRSLLSGAGVLDPSFRGGAGGPGYVSGSFGFDGAAANAVAVQPDGRIVLAGEVGNQMTTTKTYVLAVTRLNPDGSTDPNFGYYAGGGTIDIGAPPASAVALGPGGIIAVAGANVPPTFGPSPTPGGGLQVDELGPNGKSLGSFGPGGGALTFTFGPGDVAQQTVGALAVEPDGSLLVGGGYVDTANSGLAEFAVAKITPSGALDTTFGTGGVALLPVPTNGPFGAEVKGIALQGDGKIVLVGTA